jgi:hypothetical protein
VRCTVCWSMDSVLEKKVRSDAGFSFPTSGSMMFFYRSHHPYFNNFLLLL